MTIQQQSESGIAVELYVSVSQREAFRQLYRETRSSMATPGAQPHISLAVFPACDLQQLNHVVEGFSRTIPVQELFLSSIAVFPVQRPTVYALPLVTRALLDLHRQFHDALGDLADECHVYYRPGHWAPHLTLGTTDSLPEAVHLLDAACQANLRGYYCFDELAVVEYLPVNVISKFALGQGSTKEDIYAG